MKARERRIAVLALVCGLWVMHAPVRAADFELTAAELARIERGETVIRSELDASQRRGTVRAALKINATPSVIFHAMTHCIEAVKFVPHLRTCRVRSRSADGAIQLVEHEIDFGWYAPRLRYVIHVDLVADQSIAFRQVTGDFKVNEGIWEFEPDATGQRTLIRYRVQIDPPAYVPNWLARSTFRKELPQLLAGLRKLCESGQIPAAGANISPNELSQ